MKLFDATKIPLLSKALEAYALRQKVTAANIANATTPAYKSQTVVFEEKLARAQEGLRLAGTAHSPKHLPIGAESKPSDIELEVRALSDDPPPGYHPMASGYNDVDIDHEMAELVKNQIRYKFGSRLLGDTFKGIQKAIRGTL